jgi:DNA-binding FadR family transcriptional regulator
MERQEFALTKLREIVDGNLIKTGQRLPTERKLAEQFGVGRRTVRRALDLLEQEGRISRRQGQGTFISSPEPATQGVVEEHGLGAFLEHANPIEFMEARLTVEPILAQFAALRASKCVIEKLHILAEETRMANSADDYERADAQFHRCIAAAAKNSIFLSFFDALVSMRSDISWQQLGENNRCYKQQATYATHHRDIAEAIAAREGARARDLMYRHLSDIQERFLQRAYA